MDYIQSGQVAARKAIQLLGGPVAAARRLKVKGGSHQTVQSWLKTRVPAEYCPEIERELCGQVRCEELRPDMAWGVLREAAPAPAAGPVNNQQETRDAA